MIIDGIEFFGSEEVLKTLLPKDDGIYYDSLSKGKIKLEDMHREHLTNAFYAELFRSMMAIPFNLKKRDYIKAIYATIHQYVEAISLVDVKVDTDPVVLKLANELIKRGL